MLTLTVAIPASSKGSDFCTKCTGSIWGVVQSKHDELIWDQGKFKYLLVSLRSPPETSQPYNSHREGQKTIALQVSVGPGKINPHTGLVLSALGTSGTAHDLNSKDKARPLPQWKTVLIYHP